jgi:hypothetical protein
MFCVGNFSKMPIRKTTHIIAEMILLMNLTTSQSEERSALNFLSAKAQKRTSAMIRAIQITPQMKYWKMPTALSQNFQVRYS